jgi:hypothetical protein
MKQKSNSTIAKNYYDQLSKDAQNVAPQIENLLQGLSVSDMIDLMGCLKEKVLDKTKADLRG